MADDGAHDLETIADDAVVNVAAGFEPLWVAPGTTGSWSEGGLAAPASGMRPAHREEDYRRGYEDGSRDAEAMRVEAEAKARLACDAELEAVRRQACQECAELLSARIDAELAAVESRLQAAAYGSLSPLVTRRMTEVAAQDIAGAVARIIALKGQAVLRLTGPARFLAPMSADFERKGWQVEATASESAEITVEIDDTAIVSALPTWIARMEAMIA